VFIDSSFTMLGAGNVVFVRLIGRSRTIDRSNLNGPCPWADSQATLEILQVNGRDGDDKP
jgi:hypothetical protein